MSDNKKIKLNLKYILIKLRFLNRSSVELMKQSLQPMVEIKLIDLMNICLNYDSAGYGIIDTNKNQCSVIDTDTH